MNARTTRFGITFRREYSPGALPDFARQMERAGLDELWVVEDCFYTSGIALAATALAATSTITVGLGIMPAVARNPVFAAMEIATLAGLYPGRFLPGFGHGVASWMRQIGAFPASQLAALEEVTVTVKRLLAGERVTFHGRHVHLDEAELIHPPAWVPPISLGVGGPKSLQLSGRVADGTILSEFASPDYIAWARAQIQRGQVDAAVARTHRLTLFTFACAGPTAEARQRLRPLIAEGIASGDFDPKLAARGILAQAVAYREEGGAERVAAAMPDEWIDDLALAGTAADWRQAIAPLVAQGVESLVVMPLPDAPIAEAEALARQLRELQTG